MLISVRIEKNGFLFSEFANTFKKMGSKSTFGSTRNCFATSYVFRLYFTYCALGKSQGQYTIANEHLLDKIIEHSGIRPSDTVLELGSGTGALSARLARVARKVYMCESDPVLARECVSRVSGEGFTNTELIEGDATRVFFPRFDVCVSNLPYSLSAPIIFKLVEHRPRWRSSLLILQREFVDALIADPGERNYSRLSMNASLYIRSERVMRINGGMFFPVPPVESALVLLTPRFPAPPIDFAEFDALVRLCFLDKKRMIRNIFDRPTLMKEMERDYKEYCHRNKKYIDIRPFPKYLNHLIENSNLGDACARKLPPEAMQHLLECFHAGGIYFTNNSTSTGYG